LNRKSATDSYLPGHPAAGAAPDRVKRNLTLARQVGGLGDGAALLCEANMIGWAHRRGAGLLRDPLARNGAAARRARRGGDIAVSDFGGSYREGKMGLRIGAGFRLSRHVYVGMSVPLGNGRLAAHRGHGNDPIQMLLGLPIMYVALRVCWALAWG
jgi:hypothetical protein